MRKIFFAIVGGVPAFVADMSGEHSLSGYDSVVKEISELVANTLEILRCGREFVVRPYIRIEHREIPGGEI